MRRYDDPVEVRKGPVAGADREVEAPEQFLWHGRLWKVVAVLGHWVETGPWWERQDRAAIVDCDLLAEREFWRVEAGGAGRGVFDLVFDWAQGSWRLTRCAD